MMKSQISAVVFCLTFSLLLCFSEGIRRKKHGLGLGEPIWMMNAELPEDEWFDQRLDHFDPTSTVIWQQKYNTNPMFFKNQSFSPVFLMIGGEGPASAKWLVTGTWLDYAEKYGALCFQLEHRYYGKSHPTKDLSTKNLKYLSSEQALADLAYFIEGMNKKYNLEETNKWIVFGGSYPGSLAAWARLKYPHLIHAAVSTSGPLLAKADFKEYFDVVRDSLATYSDKCVSAVEDANKQLEILTRHPIGIKTINSLFQLCSPLNVKNIKDVQNFFESLAGNFAGVIQYNKDNRPGSTVTLDNLCDIMTNETLGTPVARYAQVNSLMMRTYNELCLDYTYYNYINGLKMTKWNEETSEGARQWTYQTCTEFGFFQTSSSKASIFGSSFPIDLFEGMCEDAFGKNFNSERLTEDIYRTNTVYGALDIKVDRVVFVQGSIDPWHALGINESNNKNSPAIFINGTAHCANMYPASPNDPPQLREAREEISSLIGQWLKQ